METATRLLDEAQELIQNRGYNAFSYKDLAATIGIKTASIHYHFPSKGDLGAALMQRYISELDLALATIDRSSRTFKQRLKSFIKLYSDTEARGAICLCGSLASDRQTLPKALQEAIDDYIQRSEAWASKQIRAGVAAGEFAFAGRPADAATSLVSSLQGGLIVSRATSRAARGRSLLQALQRVFFATLEAA